MQGLDDTVTIGTITVAIAGDYLDFRFGGDDWRKGRPKLAAWQKRFAARPSMRETYPAGPGAEPGRSTPTAEEDRRQRRPRVKLARAPRSPPRRREYP